MVHTAAAYAKMHNRLRTLACTSSIGPGATNMITGAARRDDQPRCRCCCCRATSSPAAAPAPVLQQLESSQSQDVSVNDCFKPVSRYWDRINRPEQLITALPEAMRVLTSPAETGAVTLALPQDVQAEAFDYPAALFEPRVWTIRAAARRTAIGCSEAAAADPRAAAAADRRRRRRDLQRGDRRAARASSTRPASPVGETQAGKGALPDSTIRCRSAAIGATGTPAANRLARDADLVIVVGIAAERLHHRVEDRVPASTACASSTINVAEFDAGKHAALPLVGDARAALEELAAAARRLPRRTPSTAARSPRRKARVGARSRSRLRRIGSATGARARREVIGVLQDDARRRRDVIVCAAGSLPGDLHKLWRARDPKGYHLEYGYSCMGYEIAGGLGVKMAAPDREVYVLVGDGSYLMMAQEIVTAVQEGIATDDRAARQPRLRQHRRAVGVGRLRRLRHALPRSAIRRPGELDGDLLPVDFAANAASLGAHVVRAAHARRAPRRACRSAAAHDRRPRSSSSRSTASSASAATSRGGTCRSPKSRRSTRSRRRAESARQGGVTRRTISARGNWTR